MPYGRKSIFQTFYRKQENKGEIPQYYVEEHHEDIISPEQFNYIQTEIARRSKNSKGGGITIFSNKIKCGKCGAWYGLKTWHSNDEYRRQIYRCNDKYKVKGHTCKSPHFTEEEIRTFIEKLCVTTDLETESRKLENELKKSYLRWKV